MKRRGICVLGASGSIGRSTLDVVARHPDRFEVVAVSGNTRDEDMFAICQAHHPRHVVMRDAEAGERLARRLRAAGLDDIEVNVGADALVDLPALAAVDDVMAAIVGAAGLLPSLAAVRAGKRVFLANKECLVMAGGIFMEAVRRHQVQLLPIDSEHNAVYQCLVGQRGVRRILLTASGGPFRTRPLDAFQDITPEQACAHPNWTMGRKISVDSATMMNKGLEVIEAHWLFNLGAEAIDVLIHPQSIVHSMVEYVDGSVLAQLGNPDMRTPIAYALAYPERIASGVDFLDLAVQGQLNFEKPDYQRFPGLGLAFNALRSGPAAATVLNAANEVAVQAFLDRKISFPAITALIQAALESLRFPDPASLEDVLGIDAETRDYATVWIHKKTYSASSGLR